MVKLCALFTLALSLSLLINKNAAAVQVTLNLIQSQSTLAFTGSYGANPLIPQDDPSFPTAGTTDGDPTRFSNQTTFQGTITVDVDNVLAPTSIKLLSANMDANASGSWLPEVIPAQTDCNPPGQTSGCSSVHPPGTAASADFGVKLVAFGIDFAYAAVRNVNYNLTTEVDPDGFCDLCTQDFAPVVEPVNPQGQFNSTSTHLTYNSGFFDVWQDPLLDDDRNRDDLTGDGAMNQSLHFDNGSEVVVTPLPNAAKSTYIVSGNTVTLTIPMNIDIEPGFAQYYDGQFVATYVIPAGGLDGDHNFDETVNAADYVPWRKMGIDGEQGYVDWRTNFGESAAGAGGGGVVPEPVSTSLAIFGLIGMSLAYRGRNK